MEQATFIELIAEILEVEPNSVSFSDVLDDIDWDSLSNISFIAEIDTVLGQSIDADELTRASTVADLYSLVQGVAQEQ